MYIRAEAARCWKDNGIVKVLQTLLITLESDLYDKMKIWHMLASSTGYYRAEL
jgi:hypothetical protein